MIRRRLFSAALLSAALQFTASLSIALDLVVCSKGPDHVAIESGLADACCDPSAGAEVDCAKSPSADRCTDTPVVQGSIEPRSTLKQDLASSQPVLVPLPSIFALAPAPSWPTVAKTGPSSGPQPDLLARRSIVLLV